MYPRVYKEFQTDQHLDQYISCYWKFEKDYADGEFEHVFPDSSYELVFSRGAGHVVRGASLPRLFMVGQLKKPVDFYSVGTVENWAVRFYPWGLRPFANVKALEANEWTAATKLFAQESRTQLEKILSNENDQEVVAGLDAYFVNHLLHWQFDDVLLQKAFNELHKKDGVITVQELADFCYLSRRQVGRNIKRVTGVSPHRVTSSLRFERVRDAIMHNPDIPLAFLAQQFRYSDQSHLIKEFRQYTDMTPSAYAAIFRRAQPQMRNSHDVLFLQSN